MDIHDFQNFSHDFDAILYRKSGKYPYVSEYDQDHDIFYELCGLKASAGSVVITSPSVFKRSAVFVDGRYKLAAKVALDSSNFEILDNDYASIIEWIKRKIPIGKRLAYDPRFFSIQSLVDLQEGLSGYSLIAVDLEKVLKIQPQKRALKIHKLPCYDCINNNYDGYKKLKLSPIIESINANALCAYLLCDPCSISWILNIRDFSVSFSPLIFGYLFVEKNGKTTLYLDNMYKESHNFSSDISELSESVGSVRFEESLTRDLENKFITIIDKHHLTAPRIGIDIFETASHIIPPSMMKNGFKHINNPCISQKAIKNDEEIAGMKRAALADSKALTNVLSWIKEEKQKNTQPLKQLKITELDIVEKLIEFRKKNLDYSGYMGESFSCISAADEHSAIIHYSPTPESNAVIRNLLLIDTGAQYLYGTTDITRTVWVGDEEPPADLMEIYTAVLRGHIAIANAKFPEGTSFAQLEPLARQFLWQKFADYPHSTSHGIGYVSCVHEGLGPIKKIKEGHRIPLRAGMIISNEPGCYIEGRFGVRLENMMLVKYSEKTECAAKKISALSEKSVNARNYDETEEKYLEFETISRIPFDTRLIDESVLTEAEKEWIKRNG